MRVQVPYFSSYNMPVGCVACGNPLALHTTSIGTSSWTGKQSVSLKFPICDECNQAAKTTITASRLGCLGGLITVGFGAAFGTSLNNLFNAAGLDWLFGVIFLLGGFWFGRRLAMSGKPPELRERLVKLNKAVRMIGFSLPSLFGSQGWIKLDFANPEYGLQFTALNSGKTL